MSQPRSKRKAKAQQVRTAKRSTKQRASYKAEIKRQRTRRQTPVLWRNRVKGRAIRMNATRRLMVTTLPKWAGGNDKRAA